MPSSMSLDIRPTWAAINEFLASEAPGLLIRPNGMLDDESVPRYPDEDGQAGLIMPYAIIWHRQIRRGNARSYGGTRHDEYASGFDLSVVANNGDDAMDVAAQLADALIGWSPPGGGQITKGRGLFEGSQAVKNSDSAPSRFTTNDRFDYRWSPQPITIE